MNRTFTTFAAAAAVWGLVTLPATAQSSGSGSAGAGSSQQGGSSSGSGATDQKGSTHAGQAGSGGTGQSGAGETGTSGQSGTGQSGTASGQSGSTGATTGSSAGTQGTAAKGSSQDRTFIMEAAAGGMAEVELGRLASQKASRSEVKEFGQMMVDDHTKANDQLMKIAQDRGLAAPHALKPQDKTTQDRLSKLSGEAFDRAYMQHMVKDHQKDVALFRKHSTGASDAEVKEFASSTLPTLQKHLRRAQEIEQTVGGGTAKGTSGSSSSTGDNGHGKANTGGATGSKGSSSPSGTSGSGSGKTGTERPPQ
jgi:putative membrane protein